MSISFLQGHSIRGHVQVGLVQQHVDSGESLLTGGAEAQLHCVHEKSNPVYTLS